jgi:hypothetical protein
LKLFDVTEEELVFQYSVQFFVVGAATLPAAYCVEQNFALSQLAFSLTNVISAWLRYQSVATRTYSTTVIASAIAGAGGALSFTAFAYVSARCFSEDLQGRVTNITVQATNAGYLASMIFLPYFVTEMKLDEIVVQYKQLCVGQLLFACCLLALNGVIFIYIQQPQKADEKADKEKVPGTPSALDSEQFADEDAFYKPLTCADVPKFLTRRLVITTLCFTALQSAAFGIPGIIVNVFINLDYTTQDSAWANTALLAGGIISGVYASPLSSSPPSSSPPSSSPPS